MTPSLKLRNSWAWAFFLTFAAVTNILVLLIPYFNVFKATLGFIWLFLLPGWLILRLIRLRTKKAWERISFTVGLSILATMSAALVINTALPLLGYNRPLGTVPLMLGLDVFWTTLFALVWWRGRKKPFELRTFPLPRRDKLIAAAALPPVALAVLGATSLNNQGTGLITWFMLIYSAGYLGVLIAMRAKLKENALLFGVYCIGLALLLMTSLRGWTATGHDIQAEYRVFALTLANLEWSASSFRDAYNACLSITILPTTVREIMGVGEQYVFKTVFQMLFALVPTIVYLIARKYTTRLIALLAAIYFMAFPTFFGDMPMLNRQEIAFLFLGLVFLTMFNHRWSLARRRWLIAAFGVGVVLSHYSTTYTMIGMFALVVILRGVLKLTTNVLRPKSKRLQLVLERWRQTKPAPVNFLVIIALLGASYLWSTQLTGTGSNITRVATETIQSLQGNKADDTRSSDTNYSVVGKPGITEQERLQNYQASTVTEDRSRYRANELFPTQVYTKYQTTVVEEPDQPLSPTGNWLTRLGVDVPGLNTGMRQASAVLLQILLVAGIAILFFGRPLSHRLTNEYRLFQLTSICLLAAIVILPVLSAEYGLLRAFQQTLILSGGAVALATFALVPIRFRRLRVILPSALALGFFVSSTGVITSMLGGYPAQLHLSNSGKYYDLYYIHESEQRAAHWLEATAGSAAIAQTDRPTFNRLQQYSSIKHEGDIMPGTVLRDYYAFLGYANVNQGTSSVTYHGDPITYRYPMEFLDDHKDLLYANQGARIYR